MREFVKEFVKEVWQLYCDRQVPRAAAAMSYHLTMTFFPLIICLYALFGQNYETAVSLLNAISRFLTADAAKMIGDYLKYLSGAGGAAISVAAAAILLTSASAALRALINTINELQGGSRFGMLANYVFSFVMAIGLLVAFYVAFGVLLTGGSFLAFLEKKVPRLQNVRDWSWARFLALGGIALLSLWGVFTVAKPRRAAYRALPGALVSTVSIVVMSCIFSMFIAASARYELIYGSLATVILLMLWLYLTCQLIFVGACVNVAIRNIKRARGG